MPKKQNKTISKLAKGLVGAAVGVGIAVAAKKVLSNKKVKKQISQNYKAVKDFAKKTGQKYSQDVTKNAESNIKKIKRVAKKKR